MWLKKQDGSIITFAKLDKHETHIYIIYAHVILNHQLFKIYFNFYVYLNYIYYIVIKYLHLSLRLRINAYQSAFVIHICNII